MQNQGAEPEADVALVRISGPLAQRAETGWCAVVDGYDAITSRFLAALDAARSVVLVIDSPGGDGAGLVEAVRRMRELADAAGKPVLAYADEFAASAAYWIAMGVGDAVYLPALGAVGSVGAIAVHQDVSGAAEKEGVKYTVVRDPAGKAQGSSLEPLSEVGLARIERDVNALAGAFVAAVAARRGLAASAVRALDADMFRGAEAVRAGLADGVATLEEVLARAVQAADDKETEMKLKEAVGHLVKAPASASDEAMALSAHAAAPIMNLGRFALSLAGTADTDEATRAVASWKAAFDAAASEGPKKAAKKAAKRVALLREAVTVGFSPAAIKIDTGAEISEGNIQSQWAEMPLDTLEHVVASRRGRAAVDGDARRPDPTSAAGPTTLTAEERHAAQKFGISEADLAKHKAQLEGRN